jgi:hypothetical protein
MIDAQVIKELLTKCGIEANAIQHLLGNTKGEENVKRRKLLTAHLSAIFNLTKALHQYESMPDYSKEK